MSFYNLDGQETWDKSVNVEGLITSGLTGIIDPPAQYYAWFVLRFQAKGRWILLNCDLILSVQMKLKGPLVIVTSKKLGQSSNRTTVPGT